MKEFILQYWLLELFGLIMLGLGACWKYINGLICNRRSIQRGTQALLRNQIIHNYEKYMERKWMPVYARENMTEMYESYHDLGGNGAITQLMEELKDLQSLPSGK